MPLIAYDEQLRPVPRLARSWEINADTTELIFHLRDDVFWQDGVKTTAADVKFSYDLVHDPNTGYTYSGMWDHYGDAEAVDSFTFRVALEPHAQFLDIWRVFAPAPRHVLADVPAAELRGHPFGTTRPVGNGPFRFAERRPGQSWTFVANPDFPAELGGRPYVDRLVYRAIPEATTLLTELQTGGVDFYPLVPPEQAEALERADGARLISYPDRAYEQIIWNGRRAPFDEVRVRRALTHAIDRKAMVASVRAGYGSVANSTIPRRCFRSTTPRSVRISASIPRRRAGCWRRRVGRIGMAMGFGKMPAGRPLPLHPAGATREQRAAGTRRRWCSRICGGSASTCSCARSSSTR